MRLTSFLLHEPDVPQICQEADRVADSHLDGIAGNLDSSNA